VINKIEKEQMKTEVPKFGPGDSVDNGEGVERVFQLHSPKVAKVEVTKFGKVRRAKLNYLRDRVGKSATQIKARETKRDRDRKKAKKS